MIPENLKSISWDLSQIRKLKEVQKTRIKEQFLNCKASRDFRNEDSRTDESIYKSVLKSIITEASVCLWLKGKFNDLEFNHLDPYTYAWDVFALGRRIEIKSFSTRFFNILNKRGGNSVDMHSFEKYDISELLFACKTTESHDKIIVSPVFCMTREAYFHCKTKSVINSGYYLEYDQEALSNSTNCKVYT